MQHVVLYCEFGYAECVVALSILFVEECPDLFSVEQAVEIVRVMS